MPLILAVEPDRRQAAQLTGVIRQHVGAELILADTTEGALVAIGRRVPDLVLVPALLAPQDDAALASALRVIAAAAHVRTLTIPVFSNGVRQPSSKKGMFARLGLAREDDDAPAGCEPGVFAEQIIAYLNEAAAERQAAEWAQERGEAETTFRSGARETDDAPPWIEPSEPIQAQTAASIEEAERIEDEIPGFEEPTPSYSERAPIYVPPVAYVSHVAASEPEAQPPIDPDVAGEAYEPQLDGIALVVDSPEPFEPERPATFFAADVEASFAERAFSGLDEDKDDAKLDLLDDLTVSEENANTSEDDEDPVAVYSLELDPTFEVTAELEAMIDTPAAGDSASHPTPIDANEDVVTGELEASLDDRLPEAIDHEFEDDLEWEDEPESENEPDSALWMPLSVGPCWPPLHVIYTDTRPRAAAAVALSAPPSALDVHLGSPVEKVEKIEKPPTAAKPAAAGSDGNAPNSEWVQLIESLRSDIERLKAAPDKKPATPVVPHVAAVPSNPPDDKTKHRAGKKRQPVQDEWGFFDPEQCGFAALLAKLDEITDTPDELAQRTR